MSPKSPAEPTEPVTASTSPPTDWFAPTQQGEGFAHYLEVLRARAWWILAAVAICVAVAVLYLEVAAKSYEASSDVLVTPVPRGSTSYIGLGLPLESSDPTRDVETAARLIASTTVAARVKAQLGLPVSAEALLADVEAQPVAQSSIVTITARADTPRQSARIATAFARAAIAERTRRLDAVLDTLLPSFRSRLAQLPPAQRATDPLAARLRDLEALRLTGDPTLQLETAAVAPSSPATPRTTITLIAAVLGGLIVGIGCALGGRLFGSRLRNEDALRRYRIPILARIPAEPRQYRLSRSPALSAVPPATRDAYRLLATSLMTSHNGVQKGRILVTGPTEADGKSTAALGLAGAFAALKEDVVLIELDTRSPSLANTLGIEPEFDLVDVSEERVPLSQALVPGNKFNMTRARACAAPATENDDVLVAALGCRGANRRPGAETPGLVDLRCSGAELHRRRVARRQGSGHGRDRRRSPGAHPVEGTRSACRPALTTRHHSGRVRSARNRQHRLLRRNRADPTR